MAYAQKRLGLVPRSAAPGDLGFGAVRASMSRTLTQPLIDQAPGLQGSAYATFRHISRGCRGSGRFARRFQPRFVLVCRPFDLRAASVLARSQPTMRCRMSPALGWVVCRASNPGLSSVGHRGFPAYWTALHCTVEPGSNKQSFALTQLPSSRQYACCDTALCICTDVLVYAPVWLAQIRNLR